MNARRLVSVAGFMATALLCPLPAAAQTTTKPSPQLQPDVSLLLRLDRTANSNRVKSVRPLAEVSLPALALSPGLWKQALDELSAETKPALTHFYWTGQPMIFERHRLFYSRSSIAYTKGIILKEMAHGRMDLGIYKGRVTLERDRFYGMGPQPFSNAVAGSDIRFFRNPFLEHSDKVFLMLRWHVTLPER